MSGESIQQAQKGLQKIITLLSPEDYVAYTSFDSDVQHMTVKLLPANKDMLRKLSDAIDATGVTYQYTTSQDGRKCVIATGNTLPMKGLLKEAGFKWNAQGKVWWKYADAM